MLIITCQIYNIVVDMTKKAVKLKNKLGLKIKIERTKLSISQEELAFKANVNKNTIGAIERGEQSPTVDTLEAIAKVFDMSLQDLFNFDNL